MASSRNQPFARIYATACSCMTSQLRSPIRPLGLPLRSRTCLEHRSISIRNVGAEPIGSSQFPSDGYVRPLMVEEGAHVATVGEWSCVTPPR
jgi:hypothetical protein